ncbi:MAG: CHAT domain-containing tetratricopeptide repeat protein [Blastocatellia bacterium]
MMSNGISQSVNARGLRRLLFTLSLAASGIVSGAVTAQQEPGSLNPGVSTESDLKGGETHTYQVALTSGQFFHLVVEQKGIDVMLTLSGPDGQQLCQVDSLNGSDGPEPVVIVAEKTGTHRITVAATDEKAVAGRYAIRIAALREATPEDRRHAAAERAIEEGEKLRSQHTAAAVSAAIEKYQQALSYFLNSDDRYRHALLLYTIGVTRAESNNFRRVIENYNQALQIFEEIGDQRMVSEILNNLGGACDVLGESQKALQYYERALPLFSAQQNKSGAASVLNNLGKIHNDFADWQKALVYYLQAVPLYRAAGDRDGEALTLHNIGVAYNGLGEPDKAIEYFQQALPLLRAIGNKRAEANTLSNLGYAFTLSNDLKKAIEIYSQAHSLQQASGDRRGEGATLNYLGIAWAALGEQTRALDSLSQSLQLRRATRDRRGEALTLGHIGMVYTLLGEAEKAIETETQALEIFREVGDRQNQAKMFQGLARAELQRGHLAEARRHVEAALTLVETVRAGVSSQQLRASFLASRQDSYQLYIDVLMRLHALEPAAGHDAEALQVSERARARSLLELLSEARVDFRQGVDQKLLARERELTQLLNARATRLTQRNSSEQLAALKKEISALETEYQQVEAAIRQSSPRYAAVTQPQPLGLREIQQLLDPDTLLLEYSLGQERSFLWAVTTNSLTTHELPKQELINQTATNFYHLLTARSRIVRGETTPQKLARISQADEQLPEAARELSKLILPPEVSRPGIKRLLIVADGALQYVPFAALPEPSVVRSQLSVVKGNALRPTDNGQRTTDNGQPLIASHEIITLPSASTLDVIRRELAGRQPAPKMLAVIADPVFSADDERSRIRVVRAAVKTDRVTAARLIEHEEEKAGQLKSFAGLKVPRLPFTRQEADQILSLTPKSESFRAVDFRASRATAMSAELSRYRYLHFATHGWLDSQRPDFSALVLSLVDEQGKPQDGFLRANEIYNLDLPAELVVLSACQTGLGKEIRGEGLVGLTRSFMYAGARRVIVSLWNVNDQATSELMTQLYQQMLKGGEAPASALRSAQLALWKQKQWSAPYYWAAFVIQGEWK